MRIGFPKCNQTDSGKVEDHNGTRLYWFWRYQNLLYFMNAGHIRGRMRNRLKRLCKKVKVSPPDRQGQMTSRMAELEEALRLEAVWTHGVKV